MTVMTEPVTPTDDEARIARKSSAQLAALSKAGKAKLQLAGTGRTPIILPQGAVRLLVQALAEMGEGHAVTLLPLPAQLTTQEAADLLGVSRPFIVKEIRAGRLAHHKVGTHRRIAYQELLAYKHRCLKAHDHAMNELTKQAQKLGMGY